MKYRKMAHRRDGMGRIEKKQGSNSGLLGVLRTQIYLGNYAPANKLHKKKLGNLKPFFRQSEVEDRQRVPT